MNSQYGLKCKWSTLLNTAMSFHPLTFQMTPLSYAKSSRNPPTNSSHKTLCLNIFIRPYVARYISTINRLFPPFICGPIYIYPPSIKSRGGSTLGGGVSMDTPNPPKKNSIVKNKIFDFWTPLKKKLVYINSNINLWTPLT